VVRFAFALVGAVQPAPSHTISEYVQLFGSKEMRQRWLCEVLFAACVLFWTASILLLSFISGNAPRFTPSEDVKYSWYLLLAATVIGMASFAATVAREKAE